MTFKRRGMTPIRHFSTTSIAFAGGLVAGVGGGLVGMGGAFISLPILTDVIKLSQHMAHGTSMASVLFTSIGGSAAYWYKKDNIDTANVNFEVAGLVALSGSMAAVVGASITKKLSPKTLKYSWGLMSVCLAPLVVARDKFMITDNVQASTNIEPISPLRRFGVPLSIGAVAGLQAGIFGVGGGAIVVPALAFGTDLDYKTILGTSLAAMLPAAISGSISHYRQGTMILKVAAPLGLGCLCGSFIGGRLSKILDEKQLKWGFSCLIVALGLKSIRAARKMP